MFLNYVDLEDDRKIHAIQQVIDTMPFIMGMKNIESRYLLANRHWAQTIGVSNSQKIIGLTDDVLPCKVNQLAAVFVAEDQKIIEQHKPLTILTCAYYANDRRCLVYGTKYPVLNDIGNVAAIGACYSEMTQSPLLNLAPLLSLRDTPYGCRKLGAQFSYIIAASIPEYGLSTRQLECLFYILRGKSANEIAIILKLSKRTVETHTEFIKNKLQCDNKAQLIEKALSVGLLNTIPNSFLQSNCA